MYAYLLQVGADLLGGFRSDLLQVLGLVAVEDRHGWRGRRGSVRQLRGGSPPAFDQVAADGSPGSARLAWLVWICSMVRAGSPPSIRPGGGRRFAGIGMAGAVGADLLGGFRSDLLQVLGLVAVEDRHGWRGRRGSVRQLRGGSPPAFDQVAADGSPGSARLVRICSTVCGLFRLQDRNGMKYAGTKKHIKTLCNK